MAAGKGGGRGAAARSEGKPKSYTWRGIKLELPPVIPGSMLFALRRAAESEDVLEVLEAFIGSEQMAEVEAKVADAGLSLEETFSELGALYTAISKKYGLGLGE